MLSDWLYIGIFLTLSAFLPFAAITIAGILGPKKPNKISVFQDDPNRKIRVILF